MDARRIGEDEVERHRRAHGMAEDDDRQAGMVGRDDLVHGRHVGDDLGHAVAVAEFAGRRVRRPRRAMTTMVVRIDMAAMLAEEGCEAGVTHRVLGQPVIDLDDSSGPAFRQPGIEVQISPRWRADDTLLAEGHCRLVSPVSFNRRSAAPEKKYSMFVRCGLMRVNPGRALPWRCFRSGGERCARCVQPHRHRPACQISPC